MVSVSILSAFAYCIYSKLTALSNGKDMEMDIHEDEVSLKKEEPYSYIQYTDKVSQAWPVNYHKFCNI